MTVTKICMEKNEPVSQAKINDSIERICRAEIIEQVHSSCKQYGDVEIILMVFEKFYLRTKSMASATVEIVCYKGLQEVTIISTAGGGGLLNISFGSNSDFAKIFKKVFEGMGFKETYKFKSIYN